MFSPPLTVLCHVCTVIPKIDIFRLSFLLTFEVFSQLVELGRAFFYFTYSLLLMWGKHTAFFASLWSNIASYRSHSSETPIQYHMFRVVGMRFLHVHIKGHFCKCTNVWIKELIVLLDESVEYHRVCPGEIKF